LREYERIVLFVDEIRSSRQTHTFGGGYEDNIHAQALIFSLKLKWILYTIAQMEREGGVSPKVSPLIQVTFSYLSRNCLLEIPPFP